MIVAKLALLAGVFFAAANLKAANIELYQGGWDVGGPLTVSFAGVDLNSDSGIDITELTHFNAIFQLPDGAEAIFTLPDLENDGFFYSPDLVFIRAGTGTYHLHEIGDATGTFGAVSDIFSVVAITVSGFQAVPEPATSLMAAIGVLLPIASLWNRRRRKRQQ